MKKPLNLKQTLLLTISTLLLTACVVAPMPNPTPAPNPAPAVAQVVIPTQLFLPFIFPIDGRGRR